MALLETRLHWPATPAVIGGALFAALAGTLVGIPILRLRGHYLAMATIGFGEILYLTLLNWTALTNGPDGVRITRPFLAGAGALVYDRTFFALAVVLAAGAAFTALRIPQSAFGRQLMSVRYNQLS